MPPLEILRTDLPLKFRCKSLDHLKVIDLDILRPAQGYASYEPVKVAGLEVSHHCQYLAASTSAIPHMASQNLHDVNFAYAADAELRLHLRLCYPVDSRTEGKPQPQDNDACSFFQK